MHTVISCPELMELFTEFDTPILSSMSPDSLSPCSTNDEKRIASPQVCIGSLFTFLNDTVDSFHFLCKPIFHKNFVLNRYTYPTSPSVESIPCQEISSLRGLDQFVLFWSMIQELVPDGFITTETSPRRCSTAKNVLIYTVGFKYQGISLGCDGDRELLMKDIDGISRLYWMLKNGYVSHLVSSTYLSAHVASPYDCNHHAQQPMRSYQEQTVEQVGSMMIYLDCKSGLIYQMDWYLGY